MRGEYRKRFRKTCHTTQKSYEAIMRVSRRKYEKRFEKEDWPPRREQVLERAQGLCDVPGCLQVPSIAHHLTYDRFGHEEWRDFAAICKGCNPLLHDPGASIETPCVSAHLYDWIIAEPCGCPFCVYRREVRAAKLRLRRNLAGELNRFMLDRNEAVPGSKPAGLKREWEEGDLGDL